MPDLQVLDHRRGLFAREHEESVRCGVIDTLSASAQARRP